MVKRINVRTKKGIPLDMIRWVAIFWKMMPRKFECMVLAVALRYYQPFTKTKRSIIMMMNVQDIRKCPF